MSRDAIGGSGQLSPIATYEGRIVGHGAEEIIHLFATAMKYDLGTAP